MDSTDRAVLAALFQVTGGAGWLRNTNWGTDAELSTWFGVEVNDQGRVLKLDLKINNLQGTMSLTFRKNSRLNVAFTK